MIQEQAAAAVIIALISEKKQVMVQICIFRTMNRHFIKHIHFHINRALVKSLKSKQGT